MSKPSTGLAARRLGGPRHPDHAAGRAGDDRVAAAEGLGPHQPAGRGHEVERRAGERALEAAHIGPQHRGQVGVDDGGLGAGDEPGQGRDLVRQGHEPEPRRARQFAGPPLVGGIEVGVQEGDGDRAETVGGALRRQRAASAGSSRGRSTAPEASSRSSASTTPA